MHPRRENPGREASCDTEHFDMPARASGAVLTFFASLASIECAAFHLLARFVPGKGVVESRDIFNSSRYRSQTILPSTLLQVAAKDFLFLPFTLLSLVPVLLFANK